MKFLIGSESHGKTVYNSRKILKHFVEVSNFSAQCDVAVDWVWRGSGAVWPVKSCQMSKKLP